jgi:hypothetical protein
MASKANSRPKVNLKEYKDTIYNLYLIKRYSISDLRQYIKTIYNLDAR